MLIGSLAWLALTLGLVGIYGVISYLTLQRRTEFAIRIALGAKHRDVIGLVLLRGIVLTSSGLAGGLGGSLLLYKYVQHLLFGITPNDPAVLVGTAVLITAVGVLACLGPAMHATSSDPMKLLRT